MAARVSLHRQAKIQKRAATCVTCQQSCPKVHSGFVLVEWNSLYEKVEYAEGAKPSQSQRVAEVPRIC